MDGNKTPLAFLGLMIAIGLLIYLIRDFPPNSLDWWLKLIIALMALAFFVREI
jgi:hypothetical protein